MTDNEFKCVIIAEQIKKLTVIYETKLTLHDYNGRAKGVNVNIRIKRTQVDTHPYQF